MQFQLAKAIFAPFVPTSLLLLDSCNGFRTIQSAYSCINRNLERGCAFMFTNDSCLKLHVYAILQAGDITCSCNSITEGARLAKASTSQIALTYLNKTHQGRLHGDRRCSGSPRHPSPPHPNGLVRRTRSPVTDVQMRSLGMIGRAHARNQCPQNGVVALA